MNDPAAGALRFGAEPLYGGVELDADLRGIVDGGLAVREGAVLFASFLERNPVKAGQVARAIERMGWRNLTTYECQYNSLHLEDDSMQHGELNEDGVPRISESDQVNCCCAAGCSLPDMSPTSPATSPTHSLSGPSPPPP